MAKPRPTCKEEMNYRIEIEKPNNVTTYKYFEKERGAVRRAQKLNANVQVNIGNSWMMLEKKLQYKE